jgi:8-oxo-dGTP diphosphatase
MITVVAALVEREGRVLICQRRKEDSRGLQWEFPGGKVQPPETLTEALARELREELGVEATIGHELYRTQYRYPEHPEPLELVFFRAEVDEQPLRNLAFEQVAWAAPAELQRYDFLPADRELIRRLATGSLSLL